MKDRMHKLDKLQRGLGKLEKLRQLVGGDGNPGRPGAAFGAPGPGGLWAKLGAMPGMRAAKMLASGDLQGVILSLLEKQPRHGYEIIKALEDHSSGLYAPSPGMVYPALTYLEEMGYATASEEGKKKLYTLTKEGAAYLAQHRAGIETTLAQLQRFGQKMASFREQLSHDDHVAESFGEGDRGEARREWHALAHDFRAVKEELKVAIFEKRHLPLEDKRRVIDVLRRATKEIRDIRKK